MRTPMTQTRRRMTVVSSPNLSTCYKSTNKKHILKLKSKPIKIMSQKVIKRVGTLSKKMIWLSKTDSSLLQGSRREWISWVGCIASWLLLCGVPSRHPSSHFLFYTLKIPLHSNASYFYSSFAKINLKF